MELSLTFILPQKLFDETPSESQSQAWKDLDIKAKDLFYNISSTVFINCPINTSEPSLSQVVQEDPAASADILVISKNSWYNCFPSEDVGIFFPFCIFFFILRLSFTHCHLELM